MKSLRNKTNTEWEAKELLRLQELEEARNRAAQMEKTMRWWSDCTANWREKWSKVRNERNKAREEVKLQQVKLDLIMKEGSTCQREKRNLELENEQMRKELEQIHLLLLKHVGQWDNRLLDAIHCSEDNSNISLFSMDRELTESANMKDSGIEEYVLHESVPKHAVEMLSEESSSKNNTFDDTLSNISELSIDLTHNDELLRYNISSLQLKLDETVKNMAVEREEKLNILKSLEKVESELANIKEKCEDLKISKQEAVRELLQLKDTHNDMMVSIRADLISETSVREDMDKRLADVRAQLEHLQAENASEWGKRERLETEKLSLDRENKKLRAELRDMSDRMERRMKLQPTAHNEIRALQLELADKNKELNDAKQTQTKLKKALTDKTVELNHTSRRIEQYETEVRKLRFRIEELKRDLALAEDEVDSNNNNIRKLQRGNDDLQEQIDNLQVQIQHLTTRLRSKTKKTLIRIDRSSDELSEEDS